MPLTERRPRGPGPPRMPGSRDAAAAARGKNVETSHPVETKHAYSMFSFHWARSFHANGRPDPMAGLLSGARPPMAPCLPSVNGIQLSQHRIATTKKVTTIMSTSGRLAHSCWPRSSIAASSVSGGRKRSRPGFRASETCAALKTNFATKPILTSELVLLRSVEAADATGLLAIDHETERLTGSYRDAGYTLSNLEKWYATRAEHDDRLDRSDQAGVRHARESRHGRGRRAGRVPRPLPELGRRPSWSPRTPPEALNAALVVMPAPACWQPVGVWLPSSCSDGGVDER